MIKISKFKLINSGSTGVIIEAVEGVEKDNIMLLDQVNRTRQYGLPDELKDKIVALKYFYLNLTHHWITPYNTYFDLTTYKIADYSLSKEIPSTFLLLQTLMNHTKITGVTVKNGGFCISGEIESVEGKPVGVVTPSVTEEDDVSFFIEAMDKINEILNDLAGVITMKKLPPINARQSLMAVGKMTEDLSLKTNDELLGVLIDFLNVKGYAILKPELSGLDEHQEPDKKNETKLHTGTKSIDSHNMPEAKTEEEGEEKEKEEEEKTDFKQSLPKNIPTRKGTLASEKEFPDLSSEKPRMKVTNDDKVPEGGSLEDYEYSENLGIPPDNAEKPEVPEEEEGDKKIKDNW